MIMLQTFAVDMQRMLPQQLLILGAQRPEGLVAGAEIHPFKDQYPLTRSLIIPLISVSVRTAAVIPPKHHGSCNALLSHTLSSVSPPSEDNPKTRTWLCAYCGNRTKPFRPEAQSPRFHYRLLSLPPAHPHATFFHGRRCKCSLQSTEHVCGISRRQPVQTRHTQ